MRWLREVRKLALAIVWAEVDPMPRSPQGRARRVEQSSCWTGGGVEFIARFDDYHRTLVGYHGTSLGTALRIVNRVQGFRWSERDYDWLGAGIYFWEFAPRQALA